MKKEMQGGMGMKRGDGAKLIVALAAVLLMAGCAAPPAPPQVPEQLRATHGFVRATLPKPERLAGGRLTLKQVQGDGTFSLVPQDGVGPNSFGLWVPVGMYRIDGMKRADGQDYPALRVEAGRILDLGAVVALSIGNDDMLDVVLSHPDAELELDAAVRQLAPHLSNPQPLRWTQDGGVPATRRVPTPGAPMGGLVPQLLIEITAAKNRAPAKELLRRATSPAQAFQIAVSSVPPSQQEPGVGPDGRLYYAAELGQVRVRQADGSWDHLDTGTLQTVMSVAVAGERLVAGTDRGDLRLSDDAGKTWRAAPLRFPGQVVADIDRVGDRWFVITTTEVKDLYAIPSIVRWELHALDGGRLDHDTLIYAAPTAAPMMVIDHNRVRGVAPKDGSAYFVNGFRSIFKVDPSTLTKSDLKMPMDGVGRLDIGPDQRTLSAYVSAGMFSKLFVSTDGGTSWKPRPTPPYPGLDIQMDGSGAGRAVRWEMGAFMNHLELVTMAAGSDRWVAGPKVPESCRRLLKDAEGLSTVCVQLDDSLLSYRQGKWVAEY